MSKTRLLRVSFWAGAIADLIAAGLVLLPWRVGELGYRYSMGLAASLLFSWSFLLIWADRDPLARQGVLPPTILVVAGILLAGWVSVYLGHFPWTTVVPNSIGGAGLIGVFSWAYLKSDDDIPADDLV